MNFVANPIYELCGQPNIKNISYINKDVLYSAGNPTQYPLTTYMGEESEKE